MPEASPFWQNAFLVWAIVCVGWCAWSGWRAGVVRGAISFGGLFLAGFAGLAAAAAAPPLIGRFVPLPEPVIGLIAGVATGLACYAMLAICGALLFKKTAHQRSFVIRLLYGCGGALIGVVFGISFVWGGLLAVRGLGAFAGGEIESGRQPGAVEKAVVKMRRSIEAGGTGNMLRSIDVMPESFYRTLEKAGRVTTSPRALERLLQSPGVESITRDSRFVALTTDPDINDLARAGDLRGLIVNRKVIDAVNDPELIAKLRKIDLEEALDFALDDPAAPPRPPSE